MKALVLGIAAVLVAGLAAAEERLRTITVSGEGQVQAAPDQAQITLGVVTGSDNAAAALEGNATAMQDILAVLTGAGIAETDIQTSNISLNPRYADRTRLEEGGPQIVGYVASTNLQVRIPEILLLGTVLDDLTAAGVNQINGIGFSLSDPKPVMDRARQAAVADALARAALYAEAAGVTLGPVLSISESSGTIPGPQPFARAEAMAFDMPVAAGELTLSARVTVRFGIE